MGDIMRQWLIPAVVLLAVGGMGLGVGWSVNEWHDGNEPAPVGTAPAETGPTQAELDAQRCEAALEAVGQAASRPPNPEQSARSLEADPAFGTSILATAVERYCD